MINLNENVGNGSNENSKKAVAFVNWAIVTKNGLVKSPKGFPLFQNPDYPNPIEDKLIELAEKSSEGKFNITLSCTVVLNTGSTANVELDDIIIE